MLIPNLKIYVNYDIIIINHESKAVVFTCDSTKLLLPYIGYNWMVVYINLCQPQRTYLYKYAQKKKWKNL